VTFFVIKLEQNLVSYLDVIKAKVPKQGSGSQFIADLVEFLEMELENDRKLKGVHLFVGQSKILEPHVFFRKHQFGPLPEKFKHLRLEGSDLAYRLISQSREEVKGSEGKREKKVKDKLDDGKSDISTLTKKTTSGKNIDKHCTLCAFRLIRGGDWARHCKKLHIDVTVQGLWCGIDCLRCNGKY
jgi:hypothetical protein